MLHVRVRVYRDVCPGMRGTACISVVVQRIRRFSYIDISEVTERASDVIILGGGRLRWKSSLGSLGGDVYAFATWHIRVICTRGSAITQLLAGGSSIYDV